MSVTHSRLGRDAAPLIFRFRFAQRNIRVGVTLQSQTLNYSYNSASQINNYFHECNNIPPPPTSNPKVQEPQYTVAQRHIERLRICGAYISIEQFAAAEVLEAVIIASVTVFQLREAEL